MDKLPKEEDLLAKAIKDAAHNEIRLEGEASRDDKSIDVIFEREHEDKGISYGAQAGISESKGWGIKAFFRKIWGG